MQKTTISITNFDTIKSKLEIMEDKLSLGYDFMSRVVIQTAERDIKTSVKRLVGELGGFEHYIKAGVTKSISRGKYLKKVSISAIMDMVDKIILLPCCKTHFIAQFTGALKIAVGPMKPLERIRLHASNRVPEKVGRATPWPRRTSWF